MKRTIKKALYIAIAAVLLITAAPLNCFIGLDFPELNLPEFDFKLFANAAEIVASGKCGENVTWTLDDAGTLTIAGTGDIVTSEKTGAPWREYSQSIRRVVIPDGITSVGYYAFQDCTSLTTITLPDSVENVTSGAFYNCSSLTDIELGNGLKYISDAVFMNCTALTSVVIPEGVQKIYQIAFQGCSNLQSVTIPESLTSIRFDAFENCTALKNVYISDLEAWFNISFERYSSNPMYYAENLYLSGELVKEISIPENITAIRSYAFVGLDFVTSIHIPAAVTTICAYAFNGCRNLSSVTFDENSRLTEIGARSFSGCPITSISIPDGVTTIYNQAFDSCDSLKEIFIPAGLASITFGAFNGCSSLTDVYYGGTREQWDALIENSVSSENSNAELFNASIHFNYQSTSDFVDTDTMFVTEDGNIASLVGTTAESLLAQACDGATVVNKDGNALSGEAKIGTGAVVTLADGTAYTIIVPGDVDGDAAITAGDARAVLRASVDLEPLEGIFLTAAKVEGNENISAGDARLILRASVGLEDPADWLTKF